MANTNHNQQFLKEILRPGIEALLENQKLPDNFSVPVDKFDLYLKVFRSYLPDDFKNGLPTHSLTDKKYLKRLLESINYFISEASTANNDEKIVSNVPVLTDIIEAHEKDALVVQKVKGDVELWKKRLREQVRAHNINIIKGYVNAQLEEQTEFKKINRDRLNQLAANAASSIYDDADYSSETPSSTPEEIIKRNVRVAISEEAKHAPAEEEDQWLEITSRPQAADQAAIVAAKKLTPYILGVKQESSIAEEEIIIENPPPRPPAPSLKDIEIALESAVAESFPNATPQEKIALAKEINVQLSGRLSLPALTKQFTKTGEFRNATLPEYQAALTKEIQKIVATKKIENVPVNFAETTAKGVASVAMPYSSSPTATMIGVDMGPSTAPPPPPPPPPEGFGTATDDMGADAAMAGGVGKVIFPEGSFGDIMNSRGAPLHLLTSLSSPQGIQELGKWVLTAGPIRQFGGFILDSFPGIPRLDYLHVGIMMIGTSRSHLLRKYAELTNPNPEVPHPTSGLAKYHHDHMIKEIEARTKILDQLFKGIDNNPVLKKLYEGMYGIPGFNLFGMNLGIYNVLHPLETAQMWLINSDHVFSGILFSEATTIFSGYFQHGYFYGNMMTGSIVQQMGMVGVKWALTKVNLYEVVGPPGYRHFVFKPWHQVTLKIQQGLGAAAKGTAKWAAAQLSKTAAGKTVVAGITKLATWVGTRLGTLISGIASVIGTILLLKDVIMLVVDFLWNKVIKPLGLVFVALMAWLFGNFSLLEILASMGSGSIFSLLTANTLFMPLFGVWGLPISWMVGTFSSSLLIKSLHGVFDSITGGAGSLFGKGLSLGGNFLTGLSHLPSLAGVAFPVLVTTGSLLAGGYFFMNMFISSAFWLPSQLPQIQSSYFDVKKSAVFSGKLGEPIKYTLLINLNLGKKDSKLINIKISDKTDFSCANTPPVVSERTFTDKIPANIALLSPLSIDYEVPTDNSFNDCLVTNTATVTADVENGPTGETSFYIANVKIGNPPIQKPFGPPLKGNVCLSGYDWNESTPDGPHQGVDLCSKDKTLYSTFSNESKVLHVCASASCLDPQGGGYSLTLQLGEYLIFMGHLASPPLFKVGDRVPAEAMVGTEGHTGKALGDHVHYVVWENGQPVNPHNFGVNSLKCSCSN